MASPADQRDMIENSGSRCQRQRVLLVNGAEATPSPQRRGVSTSTPTIRRTTGVTSIITGNAISQDSPHAGSQASMKPGPLPRTRQIEMAETTHVMNKVMTAGKTSHWADAGNLRIWQLLRRALGENALQGTAVHVQAARRL
jgi:hypothetical protein